MEKVEIMIDKDDLKKMLSVHPGPWKMICSYSSANNYVEGEWIPEEIIDADGNKVMATRFGCRTQEGKLLYAKIIEIVNALHKELG